MDQEWIKWVCKVKLFQEYALKHKPNIFNMSLASRSTRSYPFNPIYIH